MNALFHILSSILSLLFIIHLHVAVSVVTLFYKMASPV